MDYRLVIHKKDGSVSKHYYPDYDTLEYNATFCAFSPKKISPKHLDKSSVGFGIKHYSQ